MDKHLEQLETMHILAELSYSNRKQQNKRGKYGLSI